MVAPQGHQFLGGGSAPVDDTRIYIYAPQGHKTHPLVPLRGVIYYNLHTTGALPPPKCLHPVGVAADLYFLTANYPNGLRSFE